MFESFKKMFSGESAETEEKEMLEQQLTNAKNELEALEEMMSDGNTSRNDAKIHDKLTTQIAGLEEELKKYSDSEELEELTEA